LIKIQYGFKILKIHRWVDNIKMDLREIGWGGMDWTDLAQDRNQGGLL
jgi:hypothetical protein